MASIIKLFIIISIILGLSSSVYWLWQRQPKNMNQNEPASTQTVVKNDNNPGSQKSLLEKPQLGQILAIGKTTLSGKSEPNQKVILINNQFSELATTDASGSFSAEASFPSGISLLQTIILDQNLTEIQNQTIPMYASKENTSGQIFIAGTVTKIFSEIITVKTETSDLEIKMTKETTITNSKPAPSPSPKTTSKTQAESEDVRVGDFVVALGQQQTDALMGANKIEIYRDNKPVISTKYMAAKIASPAKSNIFSASNLKDSRLIEFTLDKNSQIIENEKKVTAPSIEKSKTALIFYQTEDKDNLILKVHIL